MGREIAIVPTTTGVLHKAGISLSGPDWMDKLHANGIFPISIYLALMILTQQTVFR